VPEAVNADSMELAARLVVAVIEDLLRSKPTETALTQNSSRQQGHSGGDEDRGAPAPMIDPLLQKYAGG
jgi:hypothetical protein